MAGCWTRSVGPDLCRSILFILFILSPPGGGSTGKVLLLRFTTRGIPFDSDSDPDPGLEPVILRIPFIPSILSPRPADAQRGARVTVRAPGPTCVSARMVVPRAVSFCWAKAPAGGVAKRPMVKVAPATGV